MRLFSSCSRGVRLGAVSVLAGLAVAACGGSSHSSSASSSTSSSTPSQTTSSSGAIPSGVLAEIGSAVKAAEAVPKWTAPGPPVSASVLKGAAITVFPINSEIDACNQQAKDFKALGESLGANVNLINDSGQPSQWQTAVEGSVAAHDKAIVMLCGVIPGALGPQLTAAKNAGVAVVDGNYNDTTTTPGSTARPACRPPRASATTWPTRC